MMVKQIKIKKCYISTFLFEENEFTLKEWVSHYFKDNGKFEYNEIVSLNALFKYKINESPILEFLFSKEITYFKKKDFGLANIENANRFLKFFIQYNMKDPLKILMFDINSFFSIVPFDFIQKFFYIMKAFFLFLN